MKAILSYLRIFILSFGMLHLQMLPVYAQAEFNFDAMKAAKQSEAQKEGSQTSTTRSAKGENVTSQANMGMLTNMLTMMGIGLLGYALYTYTPVTMDMMIAAAAGVAYIAGEIMALKATRDKMKGKDFVLTVREDGTQDNMQRKALEEQKRSYESLAGMMDQKSSLQKIAAAGFLAAAAAALISQTYLESMRAICSTATTTYAFTCAPPVNTVPCACSAALPAIEAFGTSSRVIESTPQPSTTQTTEIEGVETSKDTLITTNCTIATTTCAGASAYRRMVMSRNPIMSSGGMQLAIGGIASVALHGLGLGSLSGLTMAIFGPFSTAIDLWLGTPVNRAIAYGGLATLSFANATISSNLAEKMRSNVQKIDEILRRMDGLQNVQPANLVAATRLGQDSIFMAANRTEADRLESKSLPCPDGKPRTGSGQCTSSKKSINDGIKTNLAGIEGLPEGFVNSAGQIGSVADDFLNNGGLTSGSLDAANNLLANSNAVRNLNRRMMDQLNDKLKKDGLTPIDFDKQQGKFVDGLTKAMMKGIDNAKSQDRDSLMAALNSMSGLQSETIADNQEEEQLIDATSVNASVAEVPSFKMPEVPKFNFGMGDDGFNAEGDNSSSLAYNERGEMQVSISDDYETSESSEIVSNKDVSIFRVISVRYLKSGIPRLLGLEE